jgi:hypothetical protein
VIYALPAEPMQQGTIHMLARRNWWRLLSSAKTEKPTASDAV